MWHCGTPAILVLTCARHNPGHYRALEWSETEQKYVENPNLGILVEVDVSPAASPLYYRLYMRSTRTTLPCPSSRPPYPHLVHLRPIGN